MPWSTPRDEPDRQFATGCTWLLVTVVVLGVAVSATVAGATEVRPHDESGPSLRIELAGSGDATLTLTRTYEFDDSTERAAFRELEANASARREALDRFVERLHRAEAREAEEQPEEFAASPHGVNVSSEGEVGVVRLTATWPGMTHQTHAHHVLDQPFAGGFETDLPVIVVGPSDYDVWAHDPAPHHDGQSFVAWTASADLGDVQVDMEPADDASPREPGSLPTLGLVLLAVIAVWLLGVWAYRG